MKIQKHNIILIGYMGSGKTSIGQQLAERLSYQFHDTDHIIEHNEGNTINHIFSVRGEEYFRSLETDLISGMHSTLNHVVLSTGGGLPLRKVNTGLLNSMGYVVYLKTSARTIVKRLEGDNTRPLLKVDELDQKVASMLAIRNPIYEKAAHKIVATDDKSMEEIVLNIIEDYLKQI